MRRFGARCGSARVTGAPAALALAWLLWCGGREVLSVRDRIRAPVGRRGFLVVPELAGREGSVVFMAGADAPCAAVAGGDNGSAICDFLFIADQSLCGWAVSSRGS